MFGCTGSENQYASLKDVPLAPARLHTVTVVTDDATLSQLLARKGYTAMTFTSNYPASDRVEASLWSVPEPVVARAVHLKGPTADAPDVRVLVMELAARGREADAATNRAFFRNVLGSDVPGLPQGIEATDGVRVQVWTYLIPERARGQQAAARQRTSRWCSTRWPSPPRTSAITRPWRSARRTARIVELVETAAQ